MPVSTSVHITHCLKYIINLRPQSILDIGCGFGMWGFLCRMYLDVAEERVQPEEWKVRIDGIELFEPYIQDHQRWLYSSIRIGDVRELASLVDRYELVIAGDVIEHLHKEEGETVIERLYEKATRALLVNIPLGDGWEHPERHGNPGELHRSQWYPEDFLAYPNIAEPFTLPVGQYGSFYCPKDVPADVRVAALVTAADHARRTGRRDRALKLIQQSSAIDPAHPDGVLFAADLFLEMQRVDEAIDVLNRAILANPEFHYAYVAKSKLLLALHRTDEAAAAARTVLGKDGISPEIRMEAEALLAG